ncbi:MAG: transcriptional antiterminator RfaH [Enterobacterales bacterium]
MIQSKPQKEFVAVENLERQGYRTYLPKISLRKRKKGKAVSQIEPMFPRYFFINLSSQTDDWSPIRSTIGVSNLVRFGLNPAKVPDLLIQGLVDREDEKGVHVEIDRTFKEGEKVRIAVGPFEGYEAIFKTSQADERALVLLNIAEQYANVKISELSLEKLS